MIGRGDSCRSWSKQESDNEIATRGINFRIALIHHFDHGQRVQVILAVASRGGAISKVALQSGANPVLSQLPGRLSVARIALERQPSLVALMEAVECGNKRAADALFSALYADLRRIAKRELARHGAPMTLSATTLLHKAYIEIAGQNGVSFPDRSRFIGYTARVMRCLIVDHARSRHAQKRGGQFEITNLRTQSENTVDDRKLTQISEALDELAKAEPALAEVVDLKFFCGLSFAEVAAMNDISERTVQRHWEKARIYLHRSLRADLED